MADDIVEDQLSGLIEAYIAHLEGEGPAPSLEGLDAGALREARNAFRVIDAARRSDLEIPPLDEDPVALALGFAPALNTSASFIISGTSAARARRQRGLKTSDVASRLRSMGLDASQQWLVRLERTSVQEVPVDLVSGLAKVLGVSSDRLSAARDKDIDPFIAWLYSDGFAAAFDEWLEEQRGRVISKDMAALARSKLVVAARRSAGDGGPGVWVAMLRSVLDELS